MSAATAFSSLEESGTHAYCSIRSLVQLLNLIDALAPFLPGSMHTFAEYVELDFLFVQHPMISESTSFSGRIIRNGSRAYRSHHFHVHCVSLQQEVLSHDDGVQHNEKQAHKYKWKNQSKGIRGSSPNRQCTCTSIQIYCTFWNIHAMFDHHQINPKLMEKDEEGSV